MRCAHTMGKDQTVRSGLLRAVWERRRRAISRSQSDAGGVA